MRTVGLLVGIMLAEAIRGEEFDDEGVAGMLVFFLFVFLIMDVIELFV